MVWNMNKHIFFVKGQTANILCFVGHKISVTTAHPPLTWAVTGNTGTDQGGHGAGGKEPACQHRRHRRHRFHPWVRKIPWRRRWQPSPVFWPGKFHNRGDWQDTIHGVAKKSETVEQLNNRLLSLCYEEYQCRFTFCRKEASLGDTQYKLT